RALDYMRRVGHFEFGLDRRAIETDDGRTIASVRELWEQGDEARGWARYWAALYGWLADRLAADPVLRDAALVVRYEDLCDDPRRTLERVLCHAELDDAGVTSSAERIHAPTYYRPSFTADEERAIAEETHAVAERYRYVEDSAAPEAQPAVAVA
ncbi:MAG TPA: hypothetical protein VF170_06490, partial [Planctomycetaceae bacterium]